MKFTVVTILPELIEPALVAGVVGRAREAGVIAVATVNPRDFTRDRHRTVDDTPYGGGPGMVMKAEPLLAAIDKACESTRAAEELAQLEREVASEPPSAPPADRIEAELVELEHEAMRRLQVPGIEAAAPVTPGRVHRILLSPSGKP